MEVPHSQPHHDPDESAEYYDSMRILSGFEDLPEEKKEEEILNMKNALNFARKVLVTEECDVLILDEVLGLIPHGIAGEAELRTILEARSGSTDLYKTGVYGAREIWDAVDEVTELVAHKSLPAPDKTAVDKENQ